MPAVVVALGTAPRAAAPIEARDSLTLRHPVGVVGDRYSRDEGTFRGYPDQEVTLVEEEDAAALGVEPLALRRNIVTRDARLDDLIGRTFRIGTAVLHGMRRCSPCHHIAMTLGQPDLKAKLRGGLRARIVHDGEVRVGDAIEVVPARLDDDMRAVVEAARLSFVATVTADGRPNLSPKGTIRVLDESRLFFLDLGSPQTRKNLKTSPWMEINVVDATSRRGYRFYGQARVHQDDETHRAARAIFYAPDDDEYTDDGAVVLTVERALPLISPGYVFTPDEHAMRAEWKPRRAELDAAFEAHVAKRGPFRMPR